MKNKPTMDRRRIAALWVALALAGGSTLAKEPNVEEQTLTPAEARGVLDELIAFLAIPNDVSEPQQIERNADHLIALLKEAGVDARRLEAGGAPYVFGELVTDERLPTVLFYSHFDGVPADASRWSSPPYEPTLRSASGARLRVDPGERVSGTARLYARSAGDSKNAIVALLTALRRVQRRGGPAVNVKFLFDGEEERESPSLARLLAAHASELEAGLLVSASGEVHQSGLPTAAFGVRGAMTVELTVHTATVDLHSGHFGNFAPNAALELCRLLAALKDSSGRVRFPGFYDRVRPLSDDERQMIEAIPRIEGGVQDLFGIARAEVDGHSLQELINLPTMNIRGIDAGYVGKEARNIIPGRASASLDVRLVADMDAERVEQLFRSWLTDRGWVIVEGPPEPALLRANPQVVELHVGEGFPATKSATSGPWADYVIRALRRAAWSDEVVIEPTEGGSLKHHLFTDLGMAYVALPTSNFDNNQHAHDENLELRYLWYGIRLFESLLETRPRPEGSGQRATG